MAALALAFPLAGLVGASLAVLGAGGSIVAVPLLIYVVGASPREAVGMSLAMVGATSLTAALLHARAGRVEGRVALPFAAAGAVTALAGARLTHLVPERALVLLFATLMLAIGLWMRSGRAARLTARAGARPRARAALLGGAVTGLLTGFLGVGGGFLIVPVLILLTGLPMARAVGTSLAIIAVNAAAGLAGHVGQGLPPWPTIGLTLAAIGGASLGLRFGGALQADALRRGFAAVVIAVAVALALATLLRPG